MHNFAFMLWDENGIATYELGIIDGMYGFRRNTPKVVRKGPNEGFCYGLHLSHRKSV